MHYNSPHHYAHPYHHLHTPSPPTTTNPAATSYFPQIPTQMQMGGVSNTFQHIPTYGGLMPFEPYMSPSQPVFQSSSLEVTKPESSTPCKDPEQSPTPCVSEPGKPDDLQGTPVDKKLPVLTLTQSAVTIPTPRKTWLYRIGQALLYTMLISACLAWKNPDKAYKLFRSIAVFGLVKCNTWMSKGKSSHLEALQLMDGVEKLSMAVLKEWKRGAILSLAKLFGVKIEAPKRLRSSDAVKTVVSSAVASTALPTISSETMNASVTAPSILSASSVTPTVSAASTSLSVTNMVTTSTGLLGSTTAKPVANVAVANIATPSTAAGANTSTLSGVTGAFVNMWTDAKSRIWSVTKK
jgi:pentatricopeptide repeat protein